MKKLLIFIIVFSISVSISANENIYKQYTTNNWRNNPAFEQIIDFDAIDYSLLNAAIFFRTNEMRLKNGVKTIKYHITLEKSATIHSNDMVSDNFFSHTNPNNISRRTPDDRGVLAGIINPYLAENIAGSFAIQYKAGSQIYIVDAQKGLFKYIDKENVIPNHTYLSFAVAVVELWMNSEGHRANILNKDAVELGCGTTFYRDTNFNNIAKFMAVQNFQFFEPVTSK
ncbi:MAG: hypothetical protein A2015_04680 [Spirochaetes bacterium GWF1_31_7]|nr:MAG: hypothetical protein A2Y30_05060 [Spirochaetes bacterium GWE1_32_154]OHD48764.1 MAG: hypothetical protein A2Y29_03035 [Spirochaetes bacterium GWE2_31_10]OHD52827.1 MAG: hypothetical protein A2015_04680 [Spirochaetes bacterium GWF1_31_7]